VLKTFSKNIVYLNVPTGFVASVILFASLRDVHIKHFTGASWKGLCGSFDFLGLYVTLASYFKTIHVNEELIT
jgi:hypothetical protein